MSTEGARIKAEQARAAVAADIAALTERISKPVRLIRLPEMSRPHMQQPRQPPAPSADADVQVTADPGLTDLAASDFKSAFVRAIKRTMADNMTSVAKGSLMAPSSRSRQR
jgi:hypothetical protein